MLDIDSPIQATKALFVETATEWPAPPNPDAAPGTHRVRRHSTGPLVREAHARPRDRTIAWF